jgi:hypothetical protein
VNRSEPVLLITAAEIDRAIPMANAGLPHRSAPGLATIGPDGRMIGGRVETRTGRGPTRVKTSRLAIASLTCAILGIFLLGIPGLIAVFLALLALGAIRGGARRGLGLAIPALLLGVLDVAGWGFLFSQINWSDFEAGPISTDAPDMTGILELEPALQRGMRANVLLERKHGMAFLGGKAVGSGVILRIDGGKALIVTNRHVVDANFPARYDGNADRLAALDPLTVHMVDQPGRRGNVVWMAPGDVDLALVRVPVPGESKAQAAFWRKGRPMRVGEAVFAIGNPHFLGWSHTQGSISQFRFHEYSGRRVRIIQHQAAINQGNSGGGLYDADGYCIGINTLTTDKRIAEGLGFAITMDTLFELAPPPMGGVTENTADAPASPRPKVKDEPGTDRPGTPKPPASVSKEAAGRH